MNTLFRASRRTGLVMAAIAVWTCMPAVCRADALEQAFSPPSADARPWVYWFWLSGNITREGITADLEAMKRVGIGGVLIMEVDQGAPVGPADFASPQWRELFKHATSEAERLGLAINMNNDAGWNGSGGPWIKPEQSMQKVVWSETAVQGPTHFEGSLAQPETKEGFYRDIAVFAVPAVGDFRIADIEHKACYVVGTGGSPAAKDLPAEMIIPKDNVIDLSSRIDPGTGRFAWDAPAGKWTILRFGHTTTGVVNAPAPASGRGLECDKLSKEGIEANFAGLMAKIIDDIGPAAGKTLVSTHIDSWENGAQNWTARMREEFRRLRGYDLLPFLPVMTGRVVGTHEISERFLWDLRQTVSDLIVENYAGHLRTLAARHGLRLSIEAYGGPCDDLPYGGQADEPMCEFWIGSFMYANAKEMASVAHTYGRPILGAEAFTATDAERWREHPGSIKALGDQAFCAGVNRFVFHRYAMQPWLDRRPGMSMGPWGLHYERTSTWWEDSKPWHEYLTRCQSMLRQGLFVADLCYLQPEASPQGLREHAVNRYDFDACSAQVAIERMKVQDGRLVLPDGMSYRLLVLPDVPTMTPRLLGRIRNLVKDGATVVGSRPAKSPSLSGYPECDKQVADLAAEIWGDCDGQKVQEHRLGAGRVVCGIAPEQVLADAGVPLDFSSRSQLNYIHRRSDDADIYFVANPESCDVQAACSFRVSGKQPELWWPETGSMEKAAVFKVGDSSTDVALRLGPSESVFVVFRKPVEPTLSIAEISRDGKPVVSTSFVGPRVVVNRALYGVLDDPSRTRDVKTKVQQVLDSGGLELPVSNLAAGDDPAPGKLKQLVVEYTLDGKPAKLTGNDRDVIQFTEDQRHFVVNKAAYGVLDDPKRTRDVKAKLQHLLDAGRRSFKVAEMAQGDDPAYMVVKTLKIEYTVDGQHLTARGQDPDLIRLSLPSSAERSVVVHRGRRGPARLEVWQSGRYDIKAADGSTKTLNVEGIAQPLQISGPWQVRFAPGGGAPESVTLDKLISWSEHNDSGVKYFSGSATYVKNFEVARDVLAKNRRAWLDLGQVEVLAEVKLNGSDLGVLWKRPYRVDVTDQLKPGQNTLEIRVVNLWPNRMIGDELLPEDSDRTPAGTLKAWPSWLADSKPSPTGRITFTSYRLYKKDEPLLPSGLIGPVRIEWATVLSLD